MRKHIRDLTYEKLEEKIKKYISDTEELSMIRKAYDFANEKHFGQKRLTGEDYIIHPLNVAYILTDIKADFETLSAAHTSMIAAIIVEVILTCIFVYAILGVTKDSSKASVAPIVIGLTLVFVHLLGFYLTGTSVNPARSLAPAIIQGGKALEQVWVFIVAPFAGGSLAALIFKYLNK